MKTLTTREHARLWRRQAGTGGWLAVTVGFVGCTIYLWAEGFVAAAMTNTAVAVVAQLGLWWAVAERWEREHGQPASPRPDGLVIGPSGSSVQPPAHVIDVGTMSGPVVLTCDTTVRGDLRAFFERGGSIDMNGYKCFLDSTLDLSRGRIVPANHGGAGGSGDGGGFAAVGPVTFTSIDRGQSRGGSGGQ